MGRSWRYALGIVALAGGMAAVAACGSTVTSVGAVPAVASDDGAVPGTDSSTTADGTTDGGTGADAHASCASSQCIDFDGGVLCEGDHGQRVCPDMHHSEACLCGGTAPSHWVNCAGGCP